MKRSECPRCTGKMASYGRMMLRCGACSSTWLEEAAFLEEWKVKDNKLAYMDGFQDDLMELVAVTRIEVLRELHKSLSNATNLSVASAQSMEEIANVSGSVEDRDIFLRQQSEAATMETVTEWVNNLIAGFEVRNGDEKE